ncbi:M20 family metallo-hydrolase [Aquibacillus sediminis]|uniref:M20 family metallo-hydrolase n=1 Tax=Aquibacillus sediminis TaxID=2574734 RepID=UPI0011088530|nr:M20 family metallo-hydrolase [Aquibacillus sediminis]
MINHNRLHNHIQELSKIGKVGETGVYRLAHSELDVKAIYQVKEWMEAAGLQTRIDNFGNLIGRLEGNNPDKPVFMIGSHIDSQPYGGRFDGTVGSLGALEVVQTLKEQQVQIQHPIEVICFADEEGTRFNKGTFGSRGITGQLVDGELERTDEQRITRRQALLDMGCNPDQLDKDVYPEGSIEAFIEVHIEQGPVLEKQDVPVGIVSGISGPVWLTVTMEGHAGHAGSVPMDQRQDALVGASEVISGFRSIVSQDPNADTVGTIGNIQVFPNSRNVIPEKVAFTIDLRDIDVSRREDYEQQFKQLLDEVAERHNLTYQVQEDMRSNPKYCADWIKDVMKQESEKLGLQAPTLMSGPFHDALVLSNVCDYGMIFVRCKDGLSHHPDEYANEHDISKGVELLYQTVYQIVTND